MNRGTPRISLSPFLALAVLCFCVASSDGTRVAPDESLSPSEYAALGIPNLERDWSAAERKTARSILLRIAEQHPTQLPRLGSKSSGTVFAKLIHEEFDRRGEFEGIFGETPVGKLERLDADGLRQLVQDNSLEGIYVTAMAGSWLFDREFVELAVRQLAKALEQRTSLEANLAELELNSHSTSGDDEFVARYRELIESNNRVLVQRLASLTDFAVAERFTPAARGEAVFHLTEQVPRIAPHLSDELREHLRENLRAAGAIPGADHRLVALSRGW